MNRKDTALLRKFGACEDAREWCKTVPDLETAWNTCERSDWMMWALGAIEYKDDKALRLFACACVRGTPLPDGRAVWDLLTDKRSRGAVDVAERYASGEATDQELAAAWDAARAAARDAARDAAWDAARDAAWDAAREWQANKLREFVTWEGVEACIGGRYGNQMDQR